MISNDIAPEVGGAAKLKKKLQVRLPPYPHGMSRGNRLHWRNGIYESAWDEARRQHISYERDDAVKIKVKLVMVGTEMWFHDVDNRLKDVLDALQGRLGKRRKTGIIQNDRQVSEVVIEKISAADSPQSSSQGTLMIRLAGRPDWLQGKSRS
jgi:Holliday junction resolvase RusA-like endonuclease